jgi:hypothetical protein
VLERAGLTVVLYRGLYVFVYIYNILLIEFNTFDHIFINVNRVSDKEQNKKKQSSLFVREHAPCRLWLQTSKLVTDTKRESTQKINI